MARAVAVALAVMIVGVGGIMALRLGGWLPGPAEAVAYLAIAIEVLALVAGVYFGAVRPRRMSWSSFGLGRVPRRWLVVGVVIGLAAVPLTALIATGLQELMGKSVTSPQLRFLAPGGFSWAGFLYILALGGVAVPFAEELLFRGLIYRWLRARWGLWPGVLASALLFGAVHVIVEVALGAFLVGIALALVLEYSRSLWAAVVLHVAFNCGSLGLMFAGLAAGPG